MLNISQVILMRTDSNLCRKKLTVPWSAPNSLIRSYLQPCTNSMWGDESESVAPIVWLYKIVDAQKEEVLFPDLLITLRSYAFRSVAFSACGRFGLWRLRFVAVSVCDRYNLSPFVLDSTRDQTTPGVGINKPISCAPLFSEFFSIVKKHTLAIEYHDYFWQVSLQLSYSDTCQILM